MTKPKGKRLRKPPEGEFRPASAGVSRAGGKVGARGGGLHARGIHRHRRSFSLPPLLAKRPLPDLSDHGISYFPRLHFGHWTFARW